MLSAGQLASTVGDSCYAIALPWYILSSHGTTVLLGLVVACYGVPRTVLIPFGGGLADKLSPRTVMLLADALRCATVSVLVVLATRHDTSLALLGPTTALTGAGEGLFLPASFAILPSLLETDQLTAGNSLFMALQQTGALLGPAIGGAVVALASPAPGFAIDAGSFAVSAISLAFIRGRRATSTTQAVSGTEEARPAVGSVLALLRTSRVLQVILVITIAGNFILGGLGEVALPALAHLQFGASGYGAVLACEAAGGVAGSLLATRTARLRRPALAATYFFLISAISIIVVPFLGGLAGAAVAMTILGITVTLGNLIMVPRLQSWAPPHMVGRLMSLIMLCSFGCAPLSVALTGLFVNSFGPVAFFVICGIAELTVTLAALVVPQWRDFGRESGPALDSAPEVAPRSAVTASGDEGPR